MDTAKQLAVQKLLSVAETYQATDIHFSVGNPPMMRIEGKLVPVPEQQLITPSFMEDVVLEWLSEHDKQELEEKRDLVVAKTFENKKRFKISVFYQQGHLSASLAAIPERIPTLNDLRFGPPAQQLAMAGRGLVLIIGPYGARQKTSLAAIIEQLNATTQKHIVTFERPVEILFADKQCVIDQREIGRDVLNLEQGLDHILDEDVDVIALTDIPHGPAAGQIIQLANAGKTVYAVLEAPTPVAAIEALLQRVPSEMADQARSQLISALAGIINQRVVLTRTNDTVMYSEVVVPDEAFGTLLLQNEIVQLQNAIYQSQVQQGVMSLDAQLVEAVRSGVVAREEALRHVSDPRVLQQQ